MTRKEAIKRLRQYQGYEPGDYGQIVKHNFDLSDETVDALLSALRPVSREQLERVWRGEWLNFYNDLSAAECSKCGELFEVSPDETPKEEFFKAFSGFYYFCPACGSAMTDEAVEMMLERWKEALENA